MSRGWLIDTNIASEWVEPRPELPVDGEVADACGRLLARVLEAGRGLGAMDALIAATCLACDLVLATRNLADFDGLGIALHAP